MPGTGSRRKCVIATLYWVASTARAGGMPARRMLSIGVTVMNKHAFALAISALLLSAASPVRAADVICYNCPPEWADWATMAKSIKADLNIDMPHDNKNSGQALAQIIA